MALMSCGGSDGAREPMATGPSTTMRYTEPARAAHAGERHPSQSSATATDGPAWEFVEGLSVRITGVTRLNPAAGAEVRGDVGLALIRVDFSYTNNGSAVNVSERGQLPVRLLFGDERDEALVDPGYVGTSDQLTRRIPPSVDAGATVHGAHSFAVPVAELDVLAVLVVEPRRYTEHLFTDVQELLGRP